MTTRRRIATALDGVSRAAAHLADRIDPPRPAGDTGSRARHPSATGVVPDLPASYASSRADLQLVHGHGASDADPTL